MTRAGVLHHFGSKERLLFELLEYRDRSDVEHLEGRQPPGGFALFHHLVKTARLNSERPGIVQAYAVLSAEAVTEDHPGQDWFPPPDPADLSSAASSVLAVMDGLQIQWLLDPDAVDLAQATAFGIDAILSSAIAGKRRRSAP